MFLFDIHRIKPTSHLAQVCYIIRIPYRYTKYTSRNPPILMTAHQNDDVAHSAHNGNDFLYPHTHTLCPLSWSISIMRYVLIDCRNCCFAVPLDFLLIQQQPKHNSLNTENTFRMHRTRPSMLLTLFRSVRTISFAVIIIMIIIVW